MSKVKNPVVVQNFDGIELRLVPDDKHEFLLTTKEVAEGFGVSDVTIRRHRDNHSDELVEGKHFSIVQNMSSGNKNLKQMLWTKRGIVRLGFFVKSKRAKKFRDWAEDLVIEEMETVGKQTEPALATVKETIEIGDVSMVILDGEDSPRVTDGLLSEKLGFNGNEMLHSMISHMIKSGSFEGNIPPTGLINHPAAGVCARQKKFNTGASITVTESQPVYYLNQKQAIRVISKTHSDKSDAVMDEILDIYKEYITQGIVVKPEVKNILQRVAKESTNRMQSLTEENIKLATQLERAIVEIEALEFRESMLTMQNEFNETILSARLDKRADVKALRSEISKILPKRLLKKDVLPRSSLLATTRNRLLAASMNPTAWSKDTENKIIRNKSNLAGLMLSYLDDEALMEMLESVGCNLPRKHYHSVKATIVETK